MTLKFYLHRATTAVGGTLPATNSSISQRAPTWVPGQTNSVVATPLMTNRVMDKTIGAVAQTSIAYTTDNVTTNQAQPLGCWLSEPLKAQTIAAQACDVAAGYSQSNAASSFAIFRPVVALWRPSTGALIARLYDGPQVGTSGGAAGTSQGNLPATFTSTAVTAEAGDVLVMEIWRGTAVQSMGTSYTNTVFFDGRVEGSTTDVAAYLIFANDVALMSEVSYKNLTGTAAGVATANETLTKVSMPDLPFAGPADTFN